MTDPKKKKPFDPSAYGAEPFTAPAAFNPEQYGATTDSGADTDINKLPPAPVSSHKSGFFRRIPESFNEQFGIPASVQQNPMEAVHGVKLAVSHPSLEVESLKDMYNSMDSAQQALIDRAYNLQQAPGIGNKARGFAMGIYASIPVLGPAYVSALDQWNSGDKGGAIGSLLALATQLKGGFRRGGERVPTVESVAEEARKTPTPETSPARLRTAAQKLLRSGPNLVRETSERFGKDVKAATEEQAAKTAKTEAVNRRLAEKHATAIRQTEAENVAAKEKYQTGVEESKQAAKEKETLAKDVDTKSAQLGKQIEQVESKVKAAGDEKFKQVRSQIGNVEAPPDELIASVKSAQGLLQGVPENIKEFNRVLGMEGTGEGELPIGPDRSVRPGEPGYEGVRQAYLEEGLIKESEPLTWDKLQSLKSRLDARLRGPKARTLNGDLKRALWSARDAVVDQMGKMAESAGAGELWDEARDFWRQYKEDFYTPQGPSGSGSPVAKAFDAVDPSNIRQPFLQTQSAIGNRGIDILKKYGEYGGNEAATLAEDVIRQHGALGEMKVPTEPQAPELKEPPAKPEFKQSPVVKQPTTPDLMKARRDAIQKKIADWQAFSKWEVRLGVMGTVGAVLASPMVPISIKAIAETVGGLVAGEQIVTRILEKKSVLDWLSKPTPADFRAIQSLPPEVRTKLAQQLKAAAADEATSTGRKLPIDPRMQQLLRAGSVGTGLGGSTVTVKSLRDKAKELAQ